MKKENTLISVIIPSFNSIKTIKRTVESILNQDMKLLKEIIVVDSSETGESRNYLKSLDNKLIKIIKPGVRIMPAIQRNIGAENSSGKLLLFLDSDVILQNNYFSEIHSAYKEGIMIGGGAVILPDFQKNIKTAVAQYYLQLNEYIPAGERRKKSCIPGCNIFCDRKMFFEAGGFPDIRAYEDTQFCHNVNKISDIWFIPEARIAHIFREDRESFYDNQELIGFHIGSNRVLPYGFIFKNSFNRFLLPVILALKLFLISSRLAKSGQGHFRKLLSSSWLVIAGLYYWSGGFLKGLRQ
ncbi:MAG TPA: glycosyltransferase [Spirochaetota bacterium]|nr:glycosyltransferase [Spirochaetota bacterium]